MEAILLALLVAVLNGAIAFIDQMLNDLIPMTPVSYTHLEGKDHFKYCIDWNRFFVQPIFYRITAWTYVTPVPYPGFTANRSMPFGACRTETAAFSVSGV